MEYESESALIFACGPWLETRIANTLSARHKSAATSMMIRV